MQCWRVEEINAASNEWCTFIVSKLKMNVFLLKHFFWKEWKYLCTYYIDFLFKRNTWLYLHSHGTRYTLTYWVIRSPLITQGPLQKWTEHSLMCQICFRITRSLSLVYFFWQITDFGHLKQIQNKAWFWIYPFCTRALQGRNQW